MGIGLAISVTGHTGFSLSRNKEGVYLVDCRLCQRPEAKRAFAKIGSWSGREFDIYRCPQCRFIFVGNAWLDYELIYGEDYYTGRGADPLTDYAEEMASFGRSIRRHEWNGIRDFVASAAGVSSDTAWLDYGCGSGGLVKFLTESGISGAVGFEQDWALARLRSLGLPAMGATELNACTERFDVVTAIEVLEHVIDPVAELRSMRRVLKPGGLLFLTTGNPFPFADRLDKWPYIVPEVHISFLSRTHWRGRCVRQALPRPTSATGLDGQG